MFEIDRTLKLFADRHAADYVHWLLGPEVQPVEKLKEELPTTTRRADVVYRVEDVQGRPFVFHLEFQAQRSEEPMSRRMMGYNVRLEEVYRLPVCSTVIYLLRQAEAGDQGRYETLCPVTGRRHLFEYGVVRLWEQKAEALLQANLPGLYPLVGLMQLREPVQEALAEAVQAIEQQVTDPAWRADLLFGFKTLTGLVHRRELLEKLIRKEAIMESPLVKEIWEEARAEGRAEGWAEGRAEGRREDILNIIVTRFDPPYAVTRELEIRLRTVDSLPVLQRLVVEASQTESLEVFLNLLERMEIEAPEGVRGDTESSEEEL